MRTFFMGTPQLAVPVFQHIAESRHEIVLTITQPDKPAGRNRQLVSPPIKTVAQETGIPVMQPVKLNDEAFIERIHTINADIGVVFAYGKILPKWLLETPRYGIINIHASLLPRWRGAAPIQRAIMAGDVKTGVTIMQMAEGLDTGDILLQRDIVIEPDDTAGSLAEKLAMLSTDVIVDALNRIEAHTVKPVKQDESHVTYAEKINESDLSIDWSKSAEHIHNHVRGLNPKPGAHTVINQITVKVFATEYVSELDIASNVEPGNVVKVDKTKGPIIMTGTQPLAITKLQPANKKVMSGAEFVRGYRI